MAEEERPIRRGSVFKWSRVTSAVTCTVQRVAKDGSWADFTMTGGGSSWGKRMALPLPSTFVRES